MSETWTMMFSNGSSIIRQQMTDMKVIHKKTAQLTDYITE